MRGSNGKYPFTSEAMAEGHPVYLSDKNPNTGMGAVISLQKKKKLLTFIQSNFGKVSEREMARMTGIGKTTVNRWCRESGLNPIKHTVNDNFFNKWSNDMSYILGYVFADGNVNWNLEKSYWAFTITASEKDYAHIERIRKLLSSTKPLLYAEKTKSYRLIVNNKRLCQKLMKLGIVPQKSLIAKFPEIPEKYLRHFIRGIIDGDGTVRYVNRKRSSYFEIQISSGSLEFLKKMVETINKKIGIDAKIRKINKNTSLVQYSCSRGKKLADWIYADTKLFLDRKFQQYKLALRAKEVMVSL